MTFRHSSSSRALIAAVGGAFLLGLAMSTPAKALDDGDENIFSSIVQLLTVGVGLGGSSEKPRIDYRERAPLVLPPNLQQLPPPGAGAAARNANWPQDYDVERNRRTAARERAPRPEYDEVGGRTAPARIAGAPPSDANDPTECKQDTLDMLCNPQGFWSTMRTRGQSERRVAVGQEPPRRALTDPPAGFRKPVTEQKYTFEVERKVDISDARGQQLEDARRQQAISRGEDPNF